MSDNNLPKPEQRNVDIGRGNYNENIEGDYQDRKTVIKADKVYITNTSSNTSRINKKANTIDTAILNDLNAEPSEKLKAFAWKKRPLGIIWTRRFEGEPKQVTVSKDPAGRYFVSFLVEEELVQWEKNEHQIGIDLGVKDVVVTSKGFASGNPKYLKKYQGKLKQAQRRLKNKQKGSNRRRKACLKIAKIHAKIADCRKSFLHKLTTQLVRENQTISIESLNIKGLMANHKLARAIADCPKGYRFAYGWGELVRQLEYKCQWHGRELVKIDRFFPSSKLCNNCGYRIKKLPLSIREWECDGCGKLNLRDKNAALNILGAGLALIARGASNGGVSSINIDDTSYVATKRESLSEGVLKDTHTDISFRASFKLVSI